MHIWEIDKQCRDKSIIFAKQVVAYIQEKSPGIECDLAWMEKRSGNMFRIEIDGIRNFTYWSRLIRPELKRMCRSRMFTMRGHGILKRPKYLELLFERK